MQSPSEKIISGVNRPKIRGFTDGGNSDRLIQQILNSQYKDEKTEQNKENVNDDSMNS